MVSCLPADVLSRILSLNCPPALALSCRHAAAVWADAEHTQTAWLLRHCTRLRHLDQAKAARLFDALAETAPRARASDTPANVHADVSSLTAVSCTQQLIVLAAMLDDRLEELKTLIDRQHDPGAGADAALAAAACAGHVGAMRRLLSTRRCSRSGQAAALLRSAKAGEAGAVQLLLAVEPAARRRLLSALPRDAMLDVCRQGSKATAAFKLLEPHLDFNTHQAMDIAVRTSNVSLVTHLLTSESIALDERDEFHRHSEIFFDAAIRCHGPGATRIINAFLAVPQRPSMKYKQSWLRGIVPHCFVKHTASQQHLLAALDFARTLPLHSAAADEAWTDLARALLPSGRYEAAVMCLRNCSSRYGEGAWSDAYEHIVYQPGGGGWLAAAGSETARRMLDLAAEALSHFRPGGLADLRSLWGYMASCARWVGEEGKAEEYSSRAEQPRRYFVPQPAPVDSEDEGGGEEGEEDEDEDEGDESEEGEEVETGDDEGTEGEEGDGDDGDSISDEEEDGQEAEASDESSEDEEA